MFNFNYFSDSDSNSNSNSSSDNEFGVFGIQSNTMFDENYEEWDEEIIYTNTTNDYTESKWIPNQIPCELLSKEIEMLGLNQIQKINRVFQKIKENGKKEKQKTKEIGEKEKEKENQKEKQKENEKINQLINWVCCEETTTLKGTECLVNQILLSKKKESKHWMDQILLSVCKKPILTEETKKIIYFLISKGCDPFSFCKQREKNSYYYLIKYLNLHFYQKLLLDDLVIEKYYPSFLKEFYLIVKEANLETFVDYMKGKKKHLIQSEYFKLFKYIILYDQSENYLEFSHQYFGTLLKNNENHFNELLKKSTNHSILHYLCFQKKDSQKEFLFQFALIKLFINQSNNMNITNDDAFINETDKFKRNSLHYLCNQTKPQYSEIIEFFIDNGININCQDKRKFTALHYLCNDKNSIHLLPIIKLLIQNEIDIFLQDENNKTAFDYLFKNVIPPFDIFIQFIDKENQIEKNSLSNINPLLILYNNYDALFNCKLNSTEMTQTETATTTTTSIATVNINEKKKFAINYFDYLKKINIDFNSRDINNQNILHYFCKKKNLNPMDSFIIKQLIERGVDINSQNYDNQTPFHLFCQTSTDINLLEIFFQNKADANIFDNKNRTPFHYMSNQENFTIEILKLFVEFGGDINVKTKFRQTILHRICYKQTNASNLIIIIKYLIKNNFDIECKDINGNTPPIYISKNATPSFLPIYNLFIQNNIDFNLVNYEQKTILHILCSQDQLCYNIIKLLIKKKNIDLNINQKKKSFTPLNILIDRYYQLKNKERDNNNKKETEKDKSVLKNTESNGNLSKLGKKTKTETEKEIEIEIENDKEGEREGEEKEENEKKENKKKENEKKENEKKENEKKENEKEEIKNNTQHEEEKLLIELIEFYIQNNKKLDTRIINKETTLHQYIKVFDPSLRILVLLINKININEVNKDGETILHLFCKNIHNASDLSILKILIKNGINLDLQSSGDINAALFILLNRLQFYEADLNNKTNLLIKSKIEKAIQILLKNGCDINLTIFSNTKPYNLLINKQVFPSIKLLKSFIKRGIDLQNEINNEDEDEDEDENANVNGNRHKGKNSDKNKNEGKGENDNKDENENEKKNENINDQKTNLLHIFCKNESKKSLETLKFLIGEGMDINSMNKNNNSPFLYLCKQKNIDYEIVEYLIKTKLINISQKNKYNFNCLHYLFNNKEYLLIEKIIDLLFTTYNNDIIAEMNIMINQQEQKTNKTPLHYLFNNKYFQNYQIFKRFIDYDLNLNLYDNEAMTPLLYYCQEKERDLDIEIMKIFVAKGVNLNLLNKSKQNCLHLIFKNGKKDLNLEIIKLFAQNGINLNAIDIWERAPIHYLCLTDLEKPPMEIIKFFLQQKPKLNFSIDEIQLENDLLLAICKVKYTPHELLELLLSSGLKVNNKISLLYHICKKYKVCYEAVKLLIEHGADVNMAYHPFRLPVITACMNPFQSMELFKLFMENGASLELTGSKTHNETILHRICTANKLNPEVVKLIIEKGVDVNQMNSGHRTAFDVHCLNRNYSLEILKIFIENGYKIKNYQVGDEHYNQPLLGMVCMYNFSLPLINFLLDHGADPEILVTECNFTSTGLIFEREETGFDTIRNLVERGVNIQNFKQYQNTPLTNYLSNRPTLSLDIIKYLVDKGANLRQISKYKYNILHHCFSKKNIPYDITEYSLKGGVSTIQKDCRGKTPFQYLDFDNISIEILKLCLKYDLNLNTQDNKGQTLLHTLLSPYYIKNYFSDDYY
ncbi:ankyrin repeat ph and sec7 domain containing protein secg-related [Anaeramoeba flamelloides]|uniref:Ankyrin repeat ph and sec7 domain containing protein secg-related n=1 Tax=Anaeramoeba flamelloides TaxID=1746091 RepID=A0AAV7Z357_9EUKA|nr:ankyrin repeat ph and sec7 domain containing protein secg-related [Anaeramoeba flamelloides]